MESKRLREYNFKENLERERKKLQYKKIVIIEKDKLMSDKLKANKTEKQLLDKCKSEVFNQAMKNKEQKLEAIFRLNKLSVIDKKEKNKTRLYAERVVKDVDLEEVFKEEPKEEE